MPADAPLVSYELGLDVEGQGGKDRTQGDRRSVPDPGEAQDGRHCRIPAIS
ncbi:hypothetical protein [Pseudochelatococcus contaminans]|uniref:hypothetical protein n=1 Tax=Pseudochelatococcus contaminans TaxID=1538103 RepID=UPI001AEDE15C|nr:hypothetical protein [Pseudochelatococcus contaminans]